MNKHTPGPWKIWDHPNQRFGCEIRMADPPTAAAVVIAEHAEPANARLIAAAPALLEAAKHASTEWRLHGQLTDSCRVLEAAIAKATE